MIRISTIFVAICMAMIAASLGLVLHAVAGLNGQESATIALAAMTFMILYNAVSMRMRDRPDIEGRIAETGELELKVVDSGIGIAPEHLSKVMIPFWQVEGEQARRFQGTGLGLPLTKALVEAHGGTLDIASELGKGTTVTIVLPAHRVVATGDEDQDSGSTVGADERASMDV